MKPGSFDPFEVKRWTLNRAVNLIISSAAHPPDRYDLCKALKLDDPSRRKKWPSEQQCISLGSGHGMTDQLRNNWKHTCKALNQAILEGNW